MKLAILCQEEPLFLGPFLQGVIRRRPERICAVFVAGRRTGGERSKTWRQVWTSLRIYWLLFEPTYFLWAMFLQLRMALLGVSDPRSVEGLARALDIPVYRVGDPNAQAFHDLLRSVGPDAVLNQSELLLTPATLAVPPRGFLNRHASLLPHFRGRIASFWAHAHEPPSYGITIHRVDEGIDTGDIILQHEFQYVDRRWPYGRVMEHMQAAAPDLFWRAVRLFEDEGFEPTQQKPVDEPFKFPKLADAEAYRRTMAARRRRPADD